MKKKQYVVIGLGRFGSSVAKTLYSLGNEVLAIDIDENKVQAISDYVTYAVEVDAVEEANLKALGIGNFEVAVIAIGEDIKASIMATLLVKELGTKYVIAKANDELHSKVLYKIGADKVVFPERDMGVKVAHYVSSSNILDFIELSSDYNIVEIIPPKEWHGKTLKELNIRSKYGLNIMAIKNIDDINVSPSADVIIDSRDIIVALGDNKSLNKLEGVITK